MKHKTASQQLKEAGVLSNDPAHLNDEHIRKIDENLTDEDVRALIDIHAKIGPIGAGDHPTGRAWLV